MRTKKRILSMLLAVCSGIIAILLPLPMLAEAHTCSDADGNHQCDICWMYMPDLCKDMDDDHCCDSCGNYMQALCIDENRLSES